MLQTSANTILDSGKNYAEESKYTHVELNKTFAHAV